MQLIYDEDKARASKKRIEDECNKKNNIVKRKQIAVIVFLFIIITGNIWVFSLSDDINNYLLIILIDIGFLLFAMFFSYIIEDKFSKCDPTQFYTADIKYYIETKDKEIINAWYEAMDRGFYVTTVNEEGIVHRSCICYLKKQESINVDEIVIDLERKTVLIPYKYNPSQFK